MSLIGIPMSKTWRMFWLLSVYIFLYLRSNTDSLYCTNINNLVHFHWLHVYTHHVVCFVSMHARLFSCFSLKLVSNFGVCFRALATPLPPYMQGLQYGWWWGWQVTNEALGLLEFFYKYTKHFILSVIRKMWENSKKLETHSFQKINYFMIPDY